MFPTTTTSAPSTPAASEQLIPASAVSVSETAIRQSLSDAAVERTASRIAAMGTDDLLPTNRDPQRAADIILKALPAFEHHRGLLDATYKAFDFSRLDGLKDAAYAAKYHNGSAHAAPAGEDAVPAAMSEAVGSRQTLTAIAKMLVARKLLSSRVIEEMPNRNGYGDVAADITRLVGALRASWDTIETRAGITKAEIDAALRTADTLSETVSRREKADVHFAAGALLKQQSFTLMVRDYDYVRGAFAFPLTVAGKPSVETFAPSVYAMRAGRKTGSPEEQTTNEPVDEDADETPEPVVQTQTPTPTFPGMTRPFATQ